MRGVPSHSAGNDFIELYNYSTGAVDLSGCILTDNPDLAKYVFPAGASIAAKGFVASPRPSSVSPRTQPAMCFSSNPPTEPGSSTLCAWMRRSSG